MNNESAKWIKLLGIFFIGVVFSAGGFYVGTKYQIDSLRDDVAELKEVIQQSNLVIASYRLENAEKRLDNLEKTVDNIRLQIAQNE